MRHDEVIPTRASLLGRLKDLGDDISWREFHQAYRGLIFSVARRAGLSQIEADEVVQDTLISVAKKMPGFTYNPAKDSFKGWLLTVTRWRIRDQLEKRAKIGQASCPPAGGGGLAPRSRSAEDTVSTATIARVADPAGFDLSALWDEEWERHLLQAGLARLKRRVHPQHYEIYHLHVILGQPAREVARALGVNAAQVHLAKHRVGRLLKRELRRLQNVM